jgi:hypothetical protein
MASKPRYSRRTRHIKLRWHFAREQVKIKTLALEKIPRIDNPADAFTKAVDKPRFARLVGMADGRAVQAVQDKSRGGRVGIRLFQYSERPLERMCQEVGVH